MKTFNMAGRYLFRRKRRSGITIGAMSFALGIMVVFYALWDGMLGDMKRNASLMDMGHLQIHAYGYLDEPSLYKKIDNPGSILEKLDSAGYSSSARLYGSGLAASGNASAGVMIWGVDPEKEKKTVKMPAYVLSGQWLSENDPKGVVLGKNLSKSLRATVGDEIVLVSQAADGSTANALYKVRGVMKSISEGINRGGLFMTTGAFRDFFSFPEGVHEIAITMPASKELPEATQELVAAFPGLEVKNWKQLNPSVAEMLEVSAAFQLPMTIIIYLAIAIVILNAMLMAVFERIREYGIMKALGVSPVGIFRLVMAETMVMTAASAVIGLLWGIPLALHLETNGINLGSTEVTMSGIAIDPVWRTIFSMRCVYYPLGALAVLALLATIPPAIRAARLNPVDAIHHK